MSMEPVRISLSEPATAPAHDHVPPPAGAMIEALRSLGYTLQSAVADIVDNSISAGATRIEVQLNWNDGDANVSVLDNGCGMDLPTLINAMRPGSRNPLEMRAAGDLGRFGMGLKTASFSQCRCVTVATKTRAGTTGVRRWDLDHVARTGDWQLLHGFHPGSEKQQECLDSLSQGTLVLWERLDRLIGGGSKQGTDHNRKQFWQQVARLQEHLASTFHI